MRLQFIREDQCEWFDQVGFDEDGEPIVVMKAVYQIWEARREYAIVNAPRADNPGAVAEAKRVMLADLQRQVTVAFDHLKGLIEHELYEPDSRGSFIVSTVTRNDVRAVKPEQLTDEVMSHMAQEIGENEALMGVWWGGLDDYCSWQGIERSSDDD